jgi:hypothetical protein
MLLAYECLFEATHGPVQIARRTPTLVKLTQLLRALEPDADFVLRKSGLRKGA